MPICWYPKFWNYKEGSVMREVSSISDKSLLNYVVNLFLLTLSQPYAWWQLHAHGAPDHMATI